jgi:hypothetical protein
MVSLYRYGIHVCGSVVVCQQVLVALSFNVDEVVVWWEKKKRQQE